MMVISVNGYSLAEFTIIGIYEITWNDLPFDALVLPSEKKGLLQALVQQTTTEPPDGEEEADRKAFDDIVQEKGMCFDSLWLRLIASIRSL